ncbi:MAG: isoleucine--tRNA ligase [Nitrospirae bacterium]|nr:isoleucine--tRNA ligase [Nitrospirota bacterium]
MSSEKTDYKATLNLPRTEFPMKANLREREPALLRGWEEGRVYEKMVQAAQGRPRFILHDGPPYANGHLHMGHALNKVLKDIVVKHKFLSGFQAPFVPGWDCHGLPIELQVEQENGEAAKKDTREFLRLCRAYARKYIEIQRSEFKRLGVFGLWDRPYETMDRRYEARIIREFAALVEKEFIVRRNKPVYWCISCRTALADAEVEYADKVSPSIYVKFPVVQTDPARKTQWPEKTFAVIWTTTPWTLPANQALCFHPRHPYVLVRAGSTGEHWILAKSRVEALRSVANPTALEVVREVPHEDLRGAHFGPPFPCSVGDGVSRFVLGEDVSMEEGTGIVHIAPGHGEEDYHIGIQHKLDVYSPVDGQGRFTADVSRFAGRQVYEANPAIIADLRERGILVGEGRVSHSYPHCWRCHNPVIFRATQQWFMSLEHRELRKKAVKWIRENVYWIPVWGQDRIGNMVQTRPDWCLSRQRRWGVPIVAWVCRECPAHVLSAELARKVADEVEARGVEAWWDQPVEHWLGGSPVCPDCGRKSTLERVNDILDVWVDSGLSYTAVLESDPALAYPADLYLEGSDQHRGWFHSSLLLSVATRDQAPYRSVLTHGFVVDGEGKKMSKSAGNVIAPSEVMDRYGAEIIRLWAASEDYSEDVRVSKEILDRLADAYRRIRNTCKFILGNLYDFKPEEAGKWEAFLQETDRWALHRMAVLEAEAKEAYDRFSFHTVFHALHNACVVDLSALYMDPLKDRLYCEAAESATRRAAQTALFHIGGSLTRTMAPILSFLAEEVWGQLPLWAGKPESVFLSPPGDDLRRFRDEALAERWDRVLAVRREVMKALEAKRAAKIIGSSLEASVELRVPEPYGAVLAGFGDEVLAEVLIVGSARVRDQIADGPDLYRGEEHVRGLAAKVGTVSGGKCPRCWRWREEVPPGGGLCGRCAKLVQ